MPVKMHFSTTNNNIISYLSMKHIVKSNLNFFGDNSNDIQQDVFKRQTKMSIRESSLCTVKH